MEQPKPIPFYVLTLAMAVTAALVGFEIPSWCGVCHQKLAFNSDLRTFYTPGYMLRTGQRQEVYDFSAIRRNQAEKVAADDGAAPFLHPAYEALLFIPISIFPYRVAYLVWAGINFLVLGFISFLLRPHLRELSKIGPTWMIPALLLGFMPIAFTIIEGQDSLLLLLVLVLAYRRIASNELQAGLLLSLGMFRFQVLLPIIGLFLLWRSLRFVIGWAVGSAAVVSLSAAITGIGAQIQYMQVLRGMSGVSIWELLRRMPNLRALFAALGLGTIPLAIASVVIFSVALVLGVRQGPRTRFLLAVSVSALVPYYLFFHDLSVLALPILLALDEAAACRNWLLMAVRSIGLWGFAAFWFTWGKLYLGVIFSLIFFITQAVAMRTSQTQQNVPVPANA